MRGNGHRVQLTSRDRLVLADLYRLRALRRDHLIALGHFRSVARCNARMLALLCGGMVHRLRAASSEWSMQSVYAPAALAARWIAEEVGEELQAVREGCRQGISPLLLEHTLRVADLRTAFGRTASAGGPRLVRWHPERECEHSYSWRAGHGAWRDETVKPDGCAVLDAGGRELYCFIEADLGHVSPGRFEAKLAGYERYAASGAFTEAYGAGRFSILVVAPTERRLRRLLNLDTAHQLSVWGATWPAVETSGPAAPIWHSPSGADPRPLRLAIGARS